MSNFALGKKHDLFFDQSAFSKFSSMLLDQWNQFRCRQLMVMGYVFFSSSRQNSSNEAKMICSMETLRRFLVTCWIFPKFWLRLMLLIMSTVSSNVSPTWRVSPSTLLFWLITVLAATFVISWPQTSTITSAVLYQVTNFIITLLR